MNPAVVYRFNIETSLEGLARNEDGTWRWTGKTHEIHEFPSCEEAAATAILVGGGGLVVPRDRPAPKPPPKPVTRKPVLRDWYTEWDERTHPL